MTQGHRHRSGSAFRSLSLAFALSLLFAIIPLGGAFAQTPPDGRFENTVELDATGAVDAAIAWSQFTFADGSSDTAALGRSDKFPDNLASSLIQGQEDAPLLLTGNEALDDAVAAELERLGVETVHILGGDAALDETVENELEAAGYTVHRDAGVTRIETAIDIARTHAASATEGLLVRAFGGPSGDETQAWADALAGGAWAADANMPVFLTQTDELNDNLRAYLEDSDITSLTVLGGTAAISEAVVAELEAMGIDVTRVSGSNRFATAIAIAEARGFADPFDAGSVILIEGQAANAWASGFAAAAYADLSNGVIVLSNGANLPPETQAYLEGTDANNDGVNDGSVTPNAEGDPQLVCGPFVDPEACADAAAALGYGEATEVAVQAVTEGPDLVSAEMGSGDEDDDEQSVIFTFDEEVNESAVSGGNFVLYQYDSDRITGGDTDVSGRQVEVIFDWDDAQQATTAAVEQGAVQDEDGNENIEASAPLQDVSFEEDDTSAPDVTDVDLDAADNTATFTFDEEVDTDVAASGDFVLVDEDGVEYDVFNPAAITVNDDGDEVTVTFTEDFTDEDEIVRAYVKEDAVTSEEDGQSNAPQSFDLDGDPEGTPRLLSATVELGNEDDDDDDNDDDTIVYRFSEAVDPGAAGDFFAVLGDGTVVEGDTVDTADSENSRVEIEYTDGELDETIVRAGVQAGAVTEETGARPNVGIQTVPVDADTFEAGRTTAPDPLSITIEEDTDSFGNVDGWIVTIDFDEVVDAFDDSLTAVYEADGDESSEDFFSDCDIDNDDESLVVCNVDEGDTDDVAAIALQNGAAEDEDNNQSYEFSASFPGEDNA